MILTVFLKGLAGVQFWYTLKILMHGQKQCKIYGSIKNIKLALTKEKNYLCSAVLAVEICLLIIDTILCAPLLPLLS